MAPRPARFSIFGASALALALAACSVHDGPTGAIRPAKSVSVSPARQMDETRLRQATEAWGKKFEANKKDKEAALNYAAGLRTLTQTQTAAAVLEEASIHHSTDREVLAAYGKILVDVGRLDQAFTVLDRANAPDRPDWRILSAQGAVLDQLKRPAEAQAYYARALKIAPGEPAILSNYGLSMALAGDLQGAEKTLRTAAAHPRADRRVRQNLALVLGFQGRYEEAEAIARQDMSAEEAAAMVADLRRGGAPAPGTAG